MIEPLIFLFLVFRIRPSLIGLRAHESLWFFNSEFFYSFIEAIFIERQFSGSLKIKLSVNKSLSHQNSCGENMYVHLAKIRNNSSRCFLLISCIRNNSMDVNIEEPYCPVAVSGQPVFAGAPVSHHSAALQLSFLLIIH